MSHAEILIAGLLVAVVGLSALARRLSVTYPIMLVVGGAMLGYLPGLPEVRLDPQVALGAQREALLKMRSDGELANEVMNKKVEIKMLNG